MRPGRRGKGKDTAFDSTLFLMGSHGPHKLTLGHAKNKWSQGLLRKPGLKSLRRWETESEMVRAGGSRLGSGSFCVLGSDVFQGRGLCWTRFTRAYKALLLPWSLARALQEEEESLCGLSRQ